MRISFAFLGALLFVIKLLDDCHHVFQLLANLFDFSFLLLDALREQKNIGQGVKNLFPQVGFP